MENIPQPADDPYTSGDTVRIHLSEDDADARFHGFVCEVVENTPDELHDLTDRPMDKHHYKLCRIETDEVLPLSFRHADLVPAEREQ